MRRTLALDRESRVILGIIVIEDLFLALYLALL